MATYFCLKIMLDLAKTVYLLDRQTELVWYQNKNRPPQQGAMADRSVAFFEILKQLNT
jgi:hypothetical protein